MTTRDTIISFLADPAAFAAGAEPDLWLRGLAEVADPLIQDHGLHALRPAQRTAWMGLAPQRVGLILGPPGTGKTHALAWMAVGYLEACRRAGRPCRILVSAFTRNAITNLLEAIGKCAALLAPPPEVSFLGSFPGPLPAGVAHIAKDPHAWESLEEDHLVVGATTWSVNWLMENAPKGVGDGMTAPLFDLVCIDEASQLVLAHGLMALAGLTDGGRVIVAGDDRQLPPIRVEHAHRGDDRRLGGSLYAFLQAAGVPEFPLEETFRLNEPLTRFPRREFYGNNYHSADSIRDRRLDLVEGWAEGLTDWERLALDPEHPMCVIVHDGPPCGTSSPFEAMLAGRLVRHLARRMPAGDLWQEQLAVISPHRAQNAAIRTELAGEFPNAVVETVDRVQGKERDAIVLSYTVADPEFALAEAAFIFGRERLNVAATRSRSKLIILLSRRLLQAVPGDTEQLEEVEIFRSFVFQANEAGKTTILGPDGREVAISIRLISFDALADIEPLRPMEAPVLSEPLRQMDDTLRDVLDAVHHCATVNTHYPNTAPDFEVAKRLARKAADLFDDLRALQRLGLIELKQINGRFGPFWSARPVDTPRRLFEVDPATLPARLEEVITGARQRGGARYSHIRVRFDWLGADGTDRLRPELDRLLEQNVLVYDNPDDGSADILIDFAQRRPQPAPPVPHASSLTTEDFQVLNRLEEIEARRINFGIFEDWHQVADLAASLRRSRDEVARSVSHLELHGFLMVGENGRIRSRTAETARALRYVKQRFRPDDAHKRPYLVRGLKVLLRDRDKPMRNRPLSGAIDRLAQLGKEFSRPLSALDAMLRHAWDTDEVNLAGFQERALEAILPAWLGKSDDRHFVITADTGSGKTEAACLPLIAGAFADRMAGKQGCRAILVYPRIRLAANQAQRLAAYLAALAQVEGTVLTLGVQTQQVPPDWEQASNEWSPTAGVAGARRFPLFNCPRRNCDTPLQILPGHGIDGADELRCPACNWHYRGWIGTKSGLKATPPNLFLPTTESLHQWMRDNRYGRLFGDDPEWDPPRAVLADEVHLYTHVHGAQVGYTLRRLLARLRLNGSDSLAIGMSATLGKPKEIWAQLAGGGDVEELTATRDEKPNNPAGREYFFFVQPEVESRGRDIAGASTSIQALMTLAHNMRRRSGDEGGYRGIAFLDSKDKVKRLHTNYRDAEMRNLAALRTRLYPDDPATGLPRRECCGQPNGCDRFRDGECWYFAANDRRQVTAAGPYDSAQGLSIARHPVFSGNNDRVEEMIRGSDIVFSTSSLEVGYDDPNMTLVYQHYAPGNLASFIQRKGRGGRGSDDRPNTGITLSLYSPRDSWYFRRPHRLLDGHSFDSPLNMANYFVRRGQVLAWLLDIMTRHERRTDTPALDAMGNLLPMIEADANAQVPVIFGADLRSLMQTESLSALMLTALGRRIPNGRVWQLRDSLPWVPRKLFGTVNLPEMAVSWEGCEEPEADDIALTLSTVAPGNVTRRFAAFDLHWRIPVEGRAPFLSRPEFEAAERLERDPASVRRALPIEAREDLGDGPLEAEILRPTCLEMQVAGSMRGSLWLANYRYDAPSRQVLPLPADAPKDNSHVDPRSTGSLRGFSMIEPRPDCAQLLSAGPMGPLFSRIESYAGEGLGQADTGLTVLRLFWGADCELKIADPSVGSIGMAQVFTHPISGATGLIGYQLTTEGLRFHLDSQLLDRFIEGEIAHLQGNEDERWYRIQMLRYLVQRRARACGINAYEALRAAELIVAAAGHAQLRPRLERLLRMWDPSRLRELLLDCFNMVLPHHPLLSPRRVERVAEAIGAPRFQTMLRQAMAELASPEEFRAFLRSVIVNSLAVRLRQAFVLHGRGHEDRVLAHAQLPIQFGEDASDVITIAENGNHGDGTARSFVAHMDEAMGHLASGLLTDCSNAAEDALMERAHAMIDRHAAWRTLDPRDPATLTRLATDLEIDLEAEEVPVQGLLHLLYGTETVGAEVFELYNLWREVRSVEERLHGTMQRQPSAWELVSAAVSNAALEDGTAPHLHALLNAYANIDDASLEERFSPESRLAEQVYRISGRLCVDGCQACLHGDNDLMPNSQAEALVSRRLLERFTAFAGLRPPTGTP